MILGRPANLILGAFTAVFNVIVLGAATQGVLLEPGLVAAINLAAAAVITAIANQPPTIAEGSNYTVVTSDATPNVKKVANRTPSPAPKP
jgi:hypothetical protein